MNGTARLGTARHAAACLEVKLDGILGDAVAAVAEATGTVSGRTGAAKYSLGVEATAQRHWAATGRF